VAEQERRSAQIVERFHAAVREEPRGGERPRLLGRQLLQRQHVRRLALDQRRQRTRVRASPAHQVGGHEAHAQWWARHD
jgi:hypothetical protein